MNFLGPALDLTVVGLGLRPGHLTIEARAAMEGADVVFALPTNLLGEEIVRQFAKRVVWLKDFYHKSDHRSQVYENMAEAVLEELAKGSKVCMALYGHPGVFCQPAHLAIRQAKQLGYSTKMLPAISAEDALFADLGIDPAETGCCAYDATLFLHGDRPWDPLALLVVWQVGVVGEDASQPTANRDLPALVRKLLEVYPPEHKVVLYLASANLVGEPEIMEVELWQVPNTEFQFLATLVVPPLTGCK